MFRLKIFRQFHRSVIQAKNCQILSFSLNKTLYFSAFSMQCIQFLILDEFCHENTNFVKSAKTSFLAPLTPKCTRVLRTTPARQPDPNGLQSPNGMAGAHETHFLQETLNCYFFTFLSCCENENLGKLVAPTDEA